MKKIKPFLITDGVFKTEVLFLIGHTAEEANRYLRKIKNKHLFDEKEKNIAGMLLKTNVDMYRIVFWPDGKNIYELVHELFHLVIRICEDKGVPNVPNIHTGHCGDETGAYLIEFYLKEVLKKIKK